jgi:hypothetical protein
MVAAYSQRAGFTGFLAMDWQDSSATEEDVAHVAEPDELDAGRARFPVGSEVTATVTDVFPANREYVVRFADCGSVLEWTGDPPRVGTASRYTVTRHLDRTRRIMITPVPRHA